MEVVTNVVRGKLYRVKSGRCNCLSPGWIPSTLGNGIMANDLVIALDDFEVSRGQIYRSTRFKVIHSNGNTKDKVSLSLCYLEAL